MSDDRLADRIACEDLVFRYVDAVNRRRPQDLRDVFAADGEWHVPSMPAAWDLDAVVARLEERLFPAVVHVATNVHVRVESDRARGRCYVREEGRLTEGRDVTILGASDDEFVRTAAGWRFARRTFELLYRGSRDPVGRWYAPR